MPLIALDYAQAQELDIGRVVARYLQALFALSVVLAVVGFMVTRTVNFDGSNLLLLWGAAALKRHSQIARKWVIWICWFGIAASIAMFTIAAVCGSNHVTVQVGVIIHNPALWKVAADASATATLCGIPIVLLSRKTALRQFGLTSAGP